MLPHSAVIVLPHSAVIVLPHSAVIVLPHSAVTVLPHSAVIALPHSAVIALPHSAVIVYVVFKVCCYYVCLSYTWYYLNGTGKLTKLITLFILKKNNARVHDHDTIFFITSISVRISFTI